jgi:hypothetical protein
MWTDKWCFTCSHEIKQTWDGWEHNDEDDAEGCMCIEDGEKCEP